MPPVAMKSATATMKNTATQKVWPVLEDLIRITGAAGIPMCSAAFRVLSYLIDAFDEVQDNKDTYAQLQTSLGSYTKTLNDFVSVLPTAYLSRSNKRDAVIARDAIKAFDSDLKLVFGLARQQEMYNKRSALLRCAYRKKIKSDIEACMRQLDRSHQAFRDAVSNVIVGKVSCISTGEASYDEWGIIGAKPLPPHVIGRMKPHAGTWYWGGFQDFVEAEVDGKDRVVKLFRGEKGEQAFLDAMRFLQKTSGPFLQIYGYSTGASIPFIVFHSGRLVSFDDFILYSMIHMQTYHEYMVRIWKCLVEIKEGAEFVVTSNRDLLDNLPRYEVNQYVERVLYGVMVGTTGSITMDVPGTPEIQHYPTMPCDAGLPINVMSEVAGHFTGRLLFGRPTYQRLYKSLGTNPEWILSRKAFEDARLDPHQAIRSLPNSIHIFSGNVTRVGGVYLFDRKKVAATMRHDFREIGMMDDVKVRWTINEPFTGTSKRLYTSGGVYRIIFTPRDFDSRLRMAPIHFTGEWNETKRYMLPFARKARRLADEYGVLVEDVYLATGASISLHFDDETPPPPASRPVSVSHPISLYLHLNEHPKRCYWTFSDVPLTPEETMAEKHIIDAIGAPHPSLYNVCTVYTQLTEHEVQGYIGGEESDEAVSEGGAVVPGGWDSAW